MTEHHHDAIVARLFERHGRTFAGEIGIDLPGGAPEALFQWLVAALLYSARISADQSTRAARALFEAGLRTPEAMAEAGWERRVEILNANGYARFDEKTAGMLGEMCETLAERWANDPNALREEAARDPEQELQLIQAFNGLGPTGAAIFAREAQDPWPELRPFADKLALRAARELGLPDDAEGLAALVPERDFTPLVAALVRTALEKDYEAVAPG